MDFLVTFPKGRYVSPNPDLATTPSNSVKRNALRLEVVPGEKTASFFASVQKFFRRLFYCRGDSIVEQTPSPTQYVDSGFKRGETRRWIERQGDRFKNIQPRPLITNEGQVDGQARQPHFPRVHRVLSKQVAPPKPPGPPPKVADIYFDGPNVPANFAGNSGAGSEVDSETDPTLKWGLENSLDLFGNPSRPK